MPPRCATIALVALLAAPAVARADDDEHGLFERPRWQRVSLVGGGINDLGGGLGPSVALGHKLCSFHLAAEYTALHL